ncbi:MAG: methyl-accepting chemotaxis protein [gamma proteobacterium symbiont of Taylorina sp.]|nr:methyl-accepting chemotaxis protein [gamma proteobacterium symbiont of Taylorina sp.]
MTLKNQLIGNFVLSILALCIIAGLGVIKMQDSSLLTQNLVEQKVPQVVDLFKFHINLDKYLTDLIAHTGSDDNNLTSQLEKQIKGYHKLIETQLSQLKGNHQFDEKEINSLVHSWQKLKKISADIIKKSNSYMKEDATELVHGEGKTTYNLISVKLGEMIVIVDKMISHETDNVISLVASARNLIIFIIVITLIMLVSSNVFIINNITQSLNKIKYALKQLAKGDLTVTVDYNKNDEISVLMKVVGETVANLREIISSIVDIADTTSNSACAMLNTSEKTNTVILQQKDEVDQAKISLNEMLSASKVISDNTNLSDNATKTSQDKVVNGSKLVEDSINVTQGVLEQIGLSYKTVSELESHSNRIGTVLDVIKNIAEQTNLLALNAAIEAARAGEAGRGFAVVADEVRTLAQKSHDSTEEIQTLIDKLHSTMSATVESMKKSQQHGEISVDKIENAGTAIQAIDESVSSLVEINHSVLHSVELQKQTSNNVSNNIQSISQLMDVTAANAIQVSDLSQTLTKQVESIEQITSKFKLSA